jgi:uncharacterized protein YcbX
MTMIDIGTVRALYRYPVKSMRGESIGAARLRWQGIDGDRQYAFYRAANTSRFPWLTGRDVGEIVTYSARYLDPANPRRSPVGVTGPEGCERDVGEVSLRDELSKAAGEEVRLLQVGRGTFDSMPISVLSTATGARLDQSCGRSVDLRRFRPNIVLDLESSGASEADWLDGTLVFGNGEAPPRLRLNARIERCAMITLDPDSAAKDLSILRRVVEDFDNLVGVYGAIEAIGSIAIGDRVRLTRGG